MADREAGLRELPRQLICLLRDSREKFPCMPIRAVDRVVSSVDKAVKTMVGQ